MLIFKAWGLQNPHELKKGITGPAREAQWPGH